MFVRVEDIERQDGPGREPRALHLGHTFKEVVLFQKYDPPISDTNPWPLQLWDVALRVVDARRGGTAQERCYPGDSVWLKMDDQTGTSFAAVAEALSLVTVGTQGVGLR